LVKNSTKTEAKTKVKKDVDKVSSIRVRKSTITRLKVHGSYGESIEKVLIRLLDEIEKNEPKFSSVRGDPTFKSSLPKEL